MNKTRKMIFIAMLIGLATCLYPNTAPVVTNVQAAQRDDGSMLVDIYYDVYDADGDILTISMQVSNDNGVTWDFSCNLILPNSHIGEGILSGTGKHIVWNVGAEHPGMSGDDFVFKIIADDGQTGSIDAEWCLVPAGDYTYGQGNTILNIDYDYEIMKYEVTNAQYLAYLQEAYAAGDIWVSGSEVQGYYPGDEHWGAGSRRFYVLGTSFAYNSSRISYNNGQFILNNPSQFTEEDYLNHPVVYVTWFGAWHFADYYGWLLPTEHEWEKAARGMTGFDYPWGNTLSSNQANYENSGDPYDNGTTPVGFYNGETHIVNGVSFFTINNNSPFEVYDMAGNVWNWVDSWYDGSYPNRRVVRGGGWGSENYKLRAWHRANGSSVDLSTSHFGFRCVRIPLH